LHRPANNLDSYNLIQTQPEKYFFMKTKLSMILLAIILLLGAYYYWHLRNKNYGSSVSLITSKSKAMQITSPAFNEKESIPTKFTCDGESISPPLEITGAPENARSLALIADDPDAPMAGGFVHWVVFNINPGTKEIKENSVPQDGVEGTTSAGQPGFVGPCPPSGTHHYQFKLYALDNMLDLNSSAKREDVEKAMEEHILDKATLVGLYKR
jgi:Raf kinase inhibitor-like YbhB/YbcL family protein